MNQQEEMDIRLWAFMDGHSTDEEELEVRRLINSDPSWKAAYDGTLLTHKVLTRSAPAQPSMRFTQNVMDLIGQGNPVPATRPYLNVWIVRGVAATFIALIVTLLVFSVASVTWSDTGSILSQNGLSATGRFSHIPFGTFRPYFIAVNIVCALALVDAVYHRRQKIAAMK